MRKGNGELRAGFEIAKRRSGILIKGASDDRGQRSAAVRFAATIQPGLCICLAFQKRASHVYASDVTCKRQDLHLRAQDTCQVSVHGLDWRSETEEGESGELGGEKLSRQGPTVGLPRRDRLLGHS